VNGETDDDDESVSETADEKRARLAAQYLKSVKRVLAEKKVRDGETSDDDADDVDGDAGAAAAAVPLDDALAAQLDDDARVLANVHVRRVAERTRLSADADGVTLWLKGLDSAVTCVAASDAMVFAGCKAGHVMQWDARTGRRVHQYYGGARAPVRGGGHAGAVLCVAVSSDGTLLLTGGQARVAERSDRRVV
jgi:hypothetical protein